jgi:hypothetical protein
MILITLHNRGWAVSEVLGRLEADVTWAKAQGLREDYDIMPNRRMIWMADRLLNLEDRLIESVESKWYFSSTPFDGELLSARNG